MIGCRQTKGQLMDNEQQTQLERLRTVLEVQLRVLSFAATYCHFQAL